MVPVFTEGTKAGTGQLWVCSWAFSSLWDLDPHNVASTICCLKQQIPKDLVELFPNAQPMLDGLLDDYLECETIAAAPAAGVRLASIW